MAVIDLFVPAVCSACHARVNVREAILCEKCRAKLKKVAAPYCQKCGSPLEETACKTCSQTDFNFQKNRSVFEYIEPLDGLMHDFKYKGHTKLVQFLAENMAEYIAAREEYRGCELICAVPLHPVRRRERGYNQSELIAKNLAKASGIPYIKALKRKRYTKSQTHLHRTERLANLKNAFVAIKTAKIRGKSVILIDDVFTTGSTLNESTKALLDAKVNKVLTLSACRA